MWKCSNCGEGIADCNICWKCGAEKDSSADSVQPTSYIVDGKFDMRAFLEEGRSQYLTAPSSSTPTWINWKRINWLRLTIFLTATAIIIYLAGYGIYLLNKHSGDSQKEYEMEAQAITNMVKKYNAEASWREKLEELDEIHISDVQEALARKDGRPVLLYVQVVDVNNSEGKSVIRFRNREARAPTFRLTLECDPQLTKKITDTRNTYFEYAVIASISSVARWPDAEDEDSEPFMVNGRCLDLMPISYQ